MNAIEPIADVMTGSLAARAMEPATGLDGSGHTTERACLNCRTVLVGAYCHQCGQKGHVHRTLRAFGHDLLHGVLHFEGKIFLTLPKLLFKPGELTRRYIAGERARFVSPLALFLFSVFTMFAVMSLLGSPMDMVDKAQSSDSRAAIQQEQAKLEDRLRKLTQDRAAAAAAGGSTAALDRQIREGRIALGFMKEMTSPPAVAPAGQGQSRPAASESEELNKLRLQVGDPGSALDQAYRAAKQNPKLLIYKLQTNAYKFSWALIILSVPLMALLFLWRWRPLYDHAVFVTYSITAVSILIILGSLLVLAGVSAAAVITAGLLFVPWHMYRQLRGGYCLRRFSALWRTAALTAGAIFNLLLFGLLLLLLGIS